MKSSSARFLYKALWSGTILPFSVKFSLACFLPLLFLLSISCERSFSANFELVQVHALKGHIFATEENGGIRSGGMSLLASKLGEIRSSGRAVIFSADNNSIHGTPAAYFSGGEYVVRLLNELGADLMVVDSREFYYGPQRLAELSELADFPLVSSNIRTAAGLQVPDYLSPYYYNPEHNVVIFGLASPNFLSRNLPANVSGLRLVDPETALALAMAEFEKTEGVSLNPDLIASVERPYVAVNAVSHKLIESDTGDLLNSLAEIAPIDLLLLGERDLEIDGISPALARPWQLFVNQGEGDESDFWALHDQWRGRLVLVDDSRSDNGQTLGQVSVRNSRASRYDEYKLDSIEVEPDPELGEVLFSIRQQSASQLRREIARAGVVIEHYYSGESPLSNLVSDALLEYSNADLVLINSGSVRSGISPGPVTLFDAYRILPFESGMVVLEVTGTAILEVLEQSSGYYGKLESEKGFLQGAGIRYELVPAELPSGGFVLDPESVIIGEESLNPGSTYKLATTAYLLNGGDGYTQFARQPVLFESAESILSIFIRHLESSPLLENRPERRISTGNSSP